MGYCAAGVLGLYMSIQWKTLTTNTNIVNILGSAPLSKIYTTLLATAVSEIVIEAIVWKLVT